MLIPKKIHYCWFGGNELPEIAIKCIESWRKYCSDYELIRWDETNSDLESCRFVKEAHEAKKWAFVSDYVRLQVIEKHGGIYLDIDVELLKGLDEFLKFDGFMGFEKDSIWRVNTGLGFGAKPNHPVLRKLMESYENTKFIMDNGDFDMMPCPHRDTKVLVSLGLAQNGMEQNINGIMVFPSDYFCPASLVGEAEITSNTVSIHHFNASWQSGRFKRSIARKKRIIKIFGGWIGGAIDMLFILNDEIKECGIQVTAKKIKKKILSFNVKNKIS
ncbi:glycosyltransferase family 32 protein [Tolumonas osonensis]|uniref:Glycosyl transferase n=1 Tax=Tolumonas osonensis TaxID=675874 RepID=A0A841GN10_9GAMM|nr:glycosyltransferase [Tolumonas osonensis]MBB6056695.1 hypothetical protein [Tolumonas osonensis]